MVAIVVAMLLLPQVRLHTANLKYTKYYSIILLTPIFKYRDTHVTYLILI